MRIVLLTRVGWAGLTESQIEAELMRILRGGFIARVDFVFPALMLVIELDGWNFHADSESFRRDRRSQNALVLEGYRVLRFSAWDVMAAPEYVTSQIVSALGLNSLPATKFGT